MKGHVWSPAERARATGLGLAQGADAAHRATGIPSRTIRRWLTSPDATILRTETRQQVAERLWSAIVEGTDAVITGLRDPAARLGDKASALRIVVEAHALISGGVTSRAEVTTVRLSPSERAQVDAFTRAVGSLSDDDLRRWLADGGVEALQAVREIEGRLDA